MLENGILVISKRHNCLINKSKPKIDLHLFVKNYIHIISKYKLKYLITKTIFSPHISTYPHTPFNSKREMSTVSNR